MAEKPKRLTPRLTPQEWKVDEQRIGAARLALFNTWIEEAKGG